MQGCYSLWRSLSRLEQTWLIIPQKSIICQPAVAVLSHIFAGQPFWITNLSDSLQKCSRNSLLINSWSQCPLCTPTQRLIFMSVFYSEMNSRNDSEVILERHVIHGDGEEFCLSLRLFPSLSGCKFCIKFMVMLGFLFEFVWPLSNNCNYANSQFYVIREEIIDGISKNIALLLNSLSLVIFDR